MSFWDSCVAMCASRQSRSSGSGVGTPGCQDKEFCVPIRRFWIYWLSSPLLRLGSLVSWQDSLESFPSSEELCHRVCLCLFHYAVIFQSPLLVLVHSGCTVMCLDSDVVTRITSLSYPLWSFCTENLCCFHRLCVLLSISFSHVHLLTWSWVLNIGQEY